jgi:hypothetical protein
VWARGDGSVELRAGTFIRPATFSSYIAARQGSIILDYQGGCMLFAMIGLSLTLLGSAADVKGKWDGKITGQRPDGTTSEDTALLVLDQKGTTITGTVGGNESDQHPITSGTIDGNKVTIQAKHSKNEREYRLELVVDGDTMKGTLTSGERKGELVVKKRKE